MKVMNVLVLTMVLTIPVTRVGATNYIVNGNFEMGSLSPWSVSVTGNIAVYPTFAGMTPRQGSSFAATNWCYDTNTCSQDLGVGRQGTLIAYLYKPYLKPDLAAGYFQGLTVISADGLHSANILADYYNQYIGDHQVFGMKDGWGGEVYPGLTVTPGVWHELKFVVGDSGLSAYWNGQAIFQNWATMTNIKTVQFGGGWATNEVGWDDISFTPPGEPLPPPPSGLNNGGFETGSLNPWTRADNTTNIAVYSSFEGMTPRTGSKFAATNYNYASNWCTQDLQVARMGTLKGYVYMPSVTYVPTVYVTSSDDKYAYIMANQWDSDNVCWMRGDWGDSGKTGIPVTPGAWHEIKFVVDYDGLHAYWDDQLVMEWYLFRDIRQVAFGSSWNTAPTGYDDFSFTPFTLAPVEKLPFYIGYWDNWMHTSVNEAEYYYQQQKEQGMNSILLWGSNWSSEIQYSGYALDAAKNLDMKMLVQINTFAMRGDPNYPTSLIDTQVNWLKSYPALVGWHFMDEPEFFVSSAWMQARYAQVKGDDPNHFLEVMHAGMDNAMTFLNAEPPLYTDCLSTDVYPVEASYSTEFSAPMWQVATDTRRGVQATQTYGKTEPYFNIVQACGTNVDGVHVYRFPTFAEERYLSYAPVVEGAKGLFYWDYFDPTLPPLQERVDFRANVVGPIATEIRSLIPMITSGSTAISASCNRHTDTTGHGIEDVCWRFGQDNVTGGCLIAVNNTASAFSVTFDVTGSVLGTLGSSPASIPVLFESRNVTMTRVGPNHWQLTDNVSAFDVNVYQLYAPPTGSSVSGTVTLQDFLGTVAGTPVTVELRSGSTRADNATLDAGGHFTVPYVAPGTYTVWVKASHWLAKLQTGIVVGGSDVTIPTAFSLINGDCDGNNSVNGADLSMVLTAMDTLSVGPADLDGDGEITSTDLSITLTNIDQIGD